MRCYAFRLLALICALHVSGAHWAALQTVAWTGMIVSRAQDNGVEEAVRTTFDGEHPCTLCHVVEEGRRHERDQEPVPIVEHLAKLSFLRPQAVALPAPVEAPVVYLRSAHQGRSRSDVPPTEPPRLA